MAALWLIRKFFQNKTTNYYDEIDIKILLKITEISAERPSVPDMLVRRA